MLSREEFEVFYQEYLLEIGSSDVISFRDYYWWEPEILEAYEKYAENREECDELVDESDIPY